MEYGPYSMYKMENNRQESIHSGHFMVSQFEADAQEDDDNGIDPEEQATNPDTGTSMDMCLPLINNSIIEIDISLAKLFKCMNLAYRQKLTSPKWNRFKGVRLRWKDKIRLNNLIWRCWHMQFVLKKKSVVCQFASPLDVDVHSKPEAVVLEGKYWKRQGDVIKAEYMKWRKFYRPKGFGAHSSLETTSEFDSLDWSPATNDSFLMGGIDDFVWTSDTLFTTINNTPNLVWPDSREIAKAGIAADFIQPSLGPLQPNLDDFMNGIPFQELLNSQFLTDRLPPVPEEGTDDLLPSGDYEFQAIMGSESMNPSTQTMSLPLTQNPTVLNQTAMNPIHYSAKLYAQPMALQRSQNVQSMCLSNDQMSQQSQMTLPMNSYPSLSHSIESIDHPKKRHLKERAVGRRSHDYNKVQPTPHQTIVYNQVIAQQSNNIQQQQQQHHQPIENVATYNHNNFSNTHNVIQHMNTPVIQTTSNSFALNNSIDALNLSNNMQMNSYHATSMPTKSPNSMDLGNSALNNQSLISLLSNNKSPDMQMESTEMYKSMSSNHPNVSYKPYPPQKSMKLNPTTNLGYNQLSPSHSSSTNNDETAQQFAKEIYRSKSLPLNATLPQLSQKESPFAVPKYQAKPNRFRSRSNSLIAKQQQLSTPPAAMQSATSEPVLSSLAQLLTANGNSMMNQPSAFTSNPGSTFNLKSEAIPKQSQPQTPQHLNHQQSIIPSITSQHQYMQTQQSSPVLQHTAANITQNMFSPPTSQHQSQSQSSSQISSPELIEQDMPPSPTRPGGSSSRYPRDSQRRVGHIHAEQKRRYNIKNGFDMLHSLIPQLQQNVNAKLSKAAMLQKGAEYIKVLRTERASIDEKIEILKKERDQLNNSLNHLQSVLPANGAPVSRERTGRVKEMYDDYVRYRTTNENWKFWILGHIFRPLFESFNSTVSVASMEELTRTAVLWVDQHCSLIEMRPAVSNQLRKLSMTTDILSIPPSSLEDEVMKAIA